MNTLYSRILNKGKYLLILGIIPFLSTLPVQKATAERTIDQPEQVMTIGAQSIDARTIILKDYLASKNSPLEDHAQDFIDAADTYGIDWKLVPSISGVESSFGVHTPGSPVGNSISYNAWGWGVYGTQSIYFDSWRTGIFTVSKGLKERYISKGLTDPYAMNKVYASSPTWGEHVAFFLNDLDTYAQNYGVAPALSSKNITDIKTAGSSATLAFNSQ